MPRKIRIVQIGAEHDHSAQTMEVLRMLQNDYTVVGLCMPEESTTLFEANRSVYEGLEIFTLDEVLSMPDLDAVYIEVEDEHLTEYAMMCAKAGLAIHMDKPGGQSTKDFNALVDYCKEHQLPFHMGYMYRYNPCIKRALKLIKDGTLGKIYSIEAQMNCYHVEAKRKWMGKYQGGMMNYLGCHLVDIILQAQGMPNKVIAQNKKSREDVGEDFGFATFEYSNGVSFAKTTCVEVGGYLRRQFVFNGEKGTIEINPTERAVPRTKSGNIISRMRVTLYDDFKGDWQRISNYKSYGPYDRYKEMEREFAKIVRGEIENPYSYEHEKQLHDLLIQACGGEN